MTLRSLALVSLCVAVLACDKSKSPDATKQADAGKAAAEKKAAAKPADAKAEPAGAPEAVPAVAAAIGKPAPEFSLVDLDGNTHTLSQYKGKIVVLEWFNPGCPFVDYAHGKGPLVDMAAKETAQGVVWLSIDSGAPGKQGAGVEANREGVTKYAIKNPVLLDESGTVGHTYGAEKTPHVFIVDAAGNLASRGGLDNAPMGEPGEGDVVPYVTNALAELRAGKAVSTPETAAYGCSVKYGKA